MLKTSPLPQNEMWHPSCRYDALIANDVPVPKHAVVRRDTEGNFIGTPPIIHENDDAIEVDGNICNIPPSNIRDEY